jgi:hypothetical protein
MGRTSWQRIFKTNDVMQFAVDCASSARYRRAGRIGQRL